MRRVHVVAHAIDRYRDRRRDTRTRAELSDEIAAGVADAIAAGRIRNHKIDGFRLFGERRRELPPELRFVWNEDETLAWFIKRTDTVDVVLTTLTRAGASRAAA